MLSSAPLSTTSTFFVCFWWFFAQRVEMGAYEWSRKDFSLTSTWSPKTRSQVPRGWWSSSWSNSAPISITSTFFVCFWWFFAQRVQMGAYEWSWKDFSLTSTWSPKTRWTVLKGWWSTSWSNSIARPSCQTASKKVHTNPFFCWKIWRKVLLKAWKFPKNIFWQFLCWQLAN